MNNIKGMSEKTRALFEQFVSEVQKESFAAGYVAGKSSIESVEEKTPNQQRAELILKAKNLVEKFESKNRRFEWIITDRMIQILIFDRNGMLMTFNRSRCAPTDVFNEWIGKAIALARALQLPVPIEFLKAVQPNQFAKGQVIHYQYGDVDEIQTIIRIDEIAKRAFFNNNGKESMKFHHLYRVNEDGYDIIDDTNAQYEVAQ